jgi:hypothetical protein
MHRTLESGRHDFIDGTVEDLTLNHVRFLICIGSNIVLSFLPFVRSFSATIIEEWISTSHDSSTSNSAHWCLESTILFTKETI